jgi:hypothetical protein
LRFSALWGEVVTARNKLVPWPLSSATAEGAIWMAEDTLATAGIGKHGAARLPSVDIDSYNIELKDDDGFLGDRASKGAFQEILISGGNH